MSSSTRIVAAAALAGLLGSSACGAHPALVDKTGAVRPVATVIHLESPDGDDPGLAYFAKDATLVSRGTLKVDVDGTTYLGQNPPDDLRLVADLRAGHQSFSYQAARDWAAVGVPTFRALDAPFLISTSAAAYALATGPLSSDVLAGLSSVGMVGIGLIPNEPRYIVSVAPLFDIAGYHGLHLRINDNPETAAMVTALGAVVVKGIDAEQTRSDLDTGSVKALEASATNIVSNDYNANASYATTYAPLLKFETVSATKAAWQSLSSRQQAALKQAAADTVVYSHQVTSWVAGQLVTSCADGLVLDQPSAPQLAAVARAAMTADPQEPAAAALEERIRSTVAGAGPQVIAAPVPAGCEIAHSAAQARRLAHPAVSPKPAPTQPAFPTGTYVTTVTVADMRGTGATGPESLKPITTTTTFLPDGRLTGFQRPSYPDNNVISGRWTVHGDLLTITWDKYMLLAPETVSWSYLDGLLTLHNVRVQDSGGRLYYAAHPWRKVS